MSVVDLALSPLAQKLVDPTSPKPLRMLAARGLAPALAPAEVVLVALALVSDDDPAVRAAALAFASAPPKGPLETAIRNAANEAALAFVHAGIALHTDSLCELFRHPFATDALRESIVKNAHIDALMHLADIDAVLGTSPRALRALASHVESTPALRARCAEIASRVSVESSESPAATANETGVDDQDISSSPSPHTDDAIGVNALPDEAVDATIQELCVALEAPPPETDVETDERRVLPLRKFLETLSVAQKIRRATIGTGEERAILVRDTNRLVADAAITSPRIQENEILRIAANRSVSSDVIRTIGESREWMKSYPIKVVLSQNPRTPLPIAMRILLTLREADLKRIAISRSVPGAISAAAKREMQKKKG